MNSSRWFLISLTVLMAAVSAGVQAAGTGYTQVNLVSDVAMTAAVTDSNLVNPWGLATSANGPIWVSDDGTGVATLYNGAGVVQALVVTMPNSANPTGIVFNPTATDFLVAGAGTAAHFIFAALKGTIFGWNSGTSAVLKATGTPPAAYTGLAIGNNGSANFLYAANNAGATIDVYDKNFAATLLTGLFIDPLLPAGYVPFNVQNIGGTLFVTYTDGTTTAGHGVVDEFDTNGLFVKRLISPGGALNAPWGLAMAPASFGDLSGDLLVGNFGDGKINAFSATTGAFIGTLNDSGGNPIVVEGLLGLLFGNGGNGGAQNELFFTAGIDSEIHGLFGKFAPILPDLTIAKSHSGDFSQGQVGATYSIVVTNSGAAPTSGTVTVTDTLPAGLTATAMAGVGWTCNVGTLTCTRSDALPASTSYPTITLTVDVGFQAAASLTNSATVSGGGENNTANDTATDPTTVAPTFPDLTIAKSHSGDFIRGQVGVTYSIVVTNSGAAPTSGTVTVTDTLPAGLTATAMAGAGWTCNVGTLTCTRSDALSAGTSYPAITLTVDVDRQAPASLTNSATVSGGGETNTANDTSSDQTTTTAIALVSVPTLQWPLLGLLGLFLAAAGVVSLRR